MVSFSCNRCQDTLKKPKLQQHFMRCHAPFTCLDCNREMGETEFPKHTSCISEAQKYEKTVWKGDKVKGKGKQKNQQQQQAQQQPEPASAPAPTPEQPPVASTSQSTGAIQPSEPGSTAAGDGESTVPSTSAKKAKKDKKRKRDTEHPAAASAEAFEKENEIIKDTQKQAAGGEGKMEMDTPAINGDADKKEDAEAKENGAGESKKKQKKFKKAKTEATSTTSATNGQSKDPKATLEAALSEALSGGGEGGVSLKDILAKAGSGTSTEELLGQLKVEKGKKGQYVLSL